MTDNSAPTAGMCGSVMRKHDDKENVTVEFSSGKYTTCMPLVKEHTVSHTRVVSGP